MNKPNKDIQIEMIYQQVVAWKATHKEESKFAAAMDPVHFVGYTEDELNGIALDDDEFATEYGLD